MTISSYLIPIGWPAVFPPGLRLSRRTGFYGDGTVDKSNLVVSWMGTDGTDHDVALPSLELA
jgi:hypothetical protein